jgi:hypothetical protein
MEVAMNNNIYSWHNEVMVATEMQDFKREMDAIRLIHDAGLANPGLFERVAIALGGAMVKIGGRLHKKYTDPHQAYQVTTCKYAA